MGVRERARLQGDDGEVIVERFPVSTRPITFVLLLIVLALWGSGTGTPAPEGKWFQIRTSRVNDGKVCSVWRIKESTDFTDDEKSEMERVGATLQEVP